MPIFEYACKDCGTNFEKLVRNSASAAEVNCPSCGQDHLEQQYSTFAAHGEVSGESFQDSPQMGCGGGLCQAPGMCNRN